MSLENEEMIRDFTKHFPLVLASFLALDAIWLGVVAPRFGLVELFA